MNTITRTARKRHKKQTTTKSKNQKSDTIKAVIYVDNAINMKFSEIEALFIKSIKEKLINHYEVVGKGN